MNTWISLPQSTGSLTTKAAFTLSDNTLCFLINFSGLQVKSKACWDVQFLYWDTGSIFSKKEAYSSREKTFLLRYRKKHTYVIQQALNENGRKLNQEIWLRAYLKPYSDITRAGCPFPVAIISSFSKLR